MYIFMSKKWLIHLKEVISSNPGLSLEACIQIAEITFFSKKKSKKKKN